MAFAVVAEPINAPSSICNPVRVPTFVNDELTTPLPNVLCERTSVLSTL